MSFYHQKPKSNKENKEKLYSFISMTENSDWIRWVKSKDVLLMNKRRRCAPTSRLWASNTEGTKKKIWEVQRQVRFCFFFCLDPCPNRPPPLGVGASAGFRNETSLRKRFKCVFFWELLKARVVSNLRIKAFGVDQNRAFIRGGSRTGPNFTLDQPQNFKRRWS